MTLLYKISSNYNKLSTRFSLILLPMNDERMRKRLSSFITRIYSVFFLGKTYNTKPSRQTKAFRGKQGFTLVELIVTTAVLAVIVAIATPIIRTQLARMEAKRIKIQLASSLASAKAESYIRRQDVIVCLSDSGGRCHRDSDNTLLLFVDKNDNNHFDAQTDILIGQHALDLKYSKLSLRVGAKRHYTKFWGDSGQPRGHFGHIKYCPTVDYNETMYLISFSQTGHIKQKFNADHPTKCNS